MPAATLLSCILLPKFKEPYLLPHLPLWEQRIIITTVITANPITPHEPHLDGLQWVQADIIRLWISEVSSHLKALFFSLSLPYRSSLSALSHLGNLESRILTLKRVFPVMSEFVCSVILHPSLSLFGRAARQKCWQTCNYYIFRNSWITTRPVKSYQQRIRNIPSWRWWWLWTCKAMQKASPRFALGVSSQFSWLMYDSVINVRFVE